MSRVRNVVQHRKPNPEFADLWDALIVAHRHELDEIPKTLDVRIASSGDVIDYVKRLKPALEARFDLKRSTAPIEQRFLALAQPAYFESREEG